MNRIPPRVRITTAIAAVLLTAPLAACGGGGGGPGMGATTTPPPPPPPPPLAIATPSTTSAEYKLNPGLAMVKPEAAWATGVTGRGVTVAVIDDGVKQGTHDLEGRISPDSTDVVLTTSGAPRNAPYDSRDQHATMVAGFVAANFNDRGAVGVAYESTILSVRADEIGPCGSEPGAPADSDCGFESFDLTKGLDYATTHGAKVVNMSLGGDGRLGTGFENALGRSVAAGEVIVAAAGNADPGKTPADSPGWPARYAIDTRYNGQIIAVGALNAAGTDIASFSYRAGVAQDYYLLAPGEDVLSGCGLPSSSGTGTVCYRGSGTSFASPVVAGAAALLFQGFPNLSAHDVVDILLRSARDMGPAGTDAIYGRGALDIERAFSPLGAVKTASATGFSVISDDSGPGAAGSLAFGDALVRGEALKTVAYDDYQRLFRINLGSAYHGPARRSLGLGGLPALSKGGVNLTSPDGARLQIAALTDSNADRPAGVAGLQEQRDGLLDVSASYAKGGLRLDLWAGRQGFTPRFDGAPVDAFSAMAGADQAMRAGLTRGRWTFSAEEGSGSRTLGQDFALAGTVRANAEQPSRYTKLMANFRDRYLSTTIGVGQLDERGGPLGGVAPPGSDLAMPAQSRFATLKTEWDAAPGLSFSAEGAIGRTDADGKLLSLRNAVSSSWTLRGVADCRLMKLACSGLAIELSQPVRVERGTVTAFLADQPKDYFDPLTYSDRRLSLSPSGRELDLRVSAWRPLGPGAFLIEGTAISEEGHRESAPLNLGVTAGWRARF